MNYIQLINNFWTMNEVHCFNSNEIATYFYLIKVNNACSWRQSFSHNNQKIMATVGISFNTLKNSRNKLKQSGLIDFKTKNGSSNVIYQILTLSNFDEVANEVSAEVGDEVANEVWSSKDKLKETKHILLEKESKDSDSSENPKVEIKQPEKPKRKKVPPKKKKFNPPSVQDVQDYCNERKNGISAYTFVNFYQSKGWKVGGQKMVDWEAAVRTWENKSKKENNQTGKFLDKGTDKLKSAI